MKNRYINAKRLTNLQLEYLNFKNPSNSENYLISSLRKFNKIYEHETNEELKDLALF